MARLGPSTPGEGQLELHWSTDRHGTVRYALYDRGEHGQLAWVDDFDQGPFDTSLEVAQWVWKALSKRLRPATC